jgi:hypothetical protein
MRLFLGLLLVFMTVAIFAGNVDASPPSKSANPLESHKADVSDTDPQDDAGAPTVALVTFGPGESYWERFGHNAIVVDETASGKRTAYNYGVFDFQESHFLLNFVLGHMHYSLYAEPLNEDIETYVAEGRSVTVQLLNLTPAQAHQLSAFLAWNVQPQYAVYQYDYFLNNCSTKLRDALNAALGGEIARQLASRPSPHTFRFDGIRLISPDFWFAFGIETGLGPSADVPLNSWQESFVPMALSAALDSVVVHDANGAAVPLVSQRQVVFAGSLPPPPASPRELRLPFLTVGLGLAVLLLFLARSTSRFCRTTFAVVVVTWWLLCGVAGLVLAGLWVFSAHWAAWRNENLMLLDPLCLALPLLWWRAPRIAGYLATLIVTFAVIAIIVRTLPGWYQGNLAFVALALPLHLVLAALAWRPAAPAASQSVAVP